MKNNKYLVPLAILVAGAMVAGAIYLGDNSKETEPTKEIEQKPEVVITPVTERDHILGNTDADVIIIEYSDFECPFCKVFHETMKQVLTDYGNKVAWVYRHFPIPELHTKAVKEAEATECAWEQGGNDAFWKFADAIFEATESNDILDLIKLPGIALETGLIVDSFNTCLANGNYTTFVEQSVAGAKAAGIRGTPYSVAFSKNGKRAIINGAEPLSMVKAKIDALLK